MVVEKVAKGLQKCPSSPSAAGKEDNQGSQNIGEIYFPGFPLQPEPGIMNSTISVSDSSTLSQAMSAAPTLSENTTIVSSFSDPRTFENSSRHLVNAPSGDESAIQTLSTRGRVEHMLFGHNDNCDEQSEAQTMLSYDTTYDPTRYNYDIQIPALDTIMSNVSSDPDSNPCRQYCMDLVTPHTNLKPDTGEV